MGDLEIECEDCGWQDYTIELVSKTENQDDKDFKYCPDCGSDNIIDIEEDDIEEYEERPL